jgi:hypothetical protein
VLALLKVKPESWVPDILDEEIECDFGSATGNAESHGI